jgi:3-oxoacyl-[acyl-carrier protein] reductase
VAAIATPASGRKHRALVTGGSRGIGAAIVRALREDGIDVVAPGREELDLSKPDSIDAFLSLYARGTGGASGPIDILVNNAGINVINALEAIRPEDWSAMVQINLTAPMRLAQGLAPGMKAAGWGRIVNLSSVFSQVTKEKRAAYSATKSGLNGLTRTLAVELAPHSILVNAVGPGYVNTELTKQNNSPSDIAKITETIPAGRLAEPVEIARLVAFLCSESNTYLTGQTLIADGGFSCK